MSKIEVLRGYAKRFFVGKITDPDQKGEDGKPKVIAKFNYGRVVFPWSRTGEDHEGKAVVGAVPSFAEVLSALQAEGIKTEFELDENNEPKEVCITSLLVDGYNAHLNQVARAKAQNTPETAKASAIALIAKKLGLSNAEAEKVLKGMMS